MVSSELVVLLIVCVSTGSTQGFCQGTQPDASGCPYVATDSTSSCVLATLQCENKECSAVISGRPRICGFTNIGAGTVSQPIQCCICTNSVGMMQSQFWDCENVTTPTPSLPSLTLSSTATVTKTLINITITTMTTMTTMTSVIINNTTSSNMAASPLETSTTTMMNNDITVIAPVVVPVVLVVCVIATIIILYQRDKHKRNRKQKTTKCPVENAFYESASPQDTDLYSHTSHGHTTTHQLPDPSVYSTLAEERDETPDTSNEGLVYSAVVVKDGKKTTVKTMATPQDEDTEQTPDTVQPVDVIDGMVYSAVIRQDGKKTSVKITVE